MPKFHGPINLNLGGVDPWAVASYDDVSHDYVIDVSGDNAKRFRAVADSYGFVEDPDLELKPVAKKAAVRAARGA